MLPKDTFFSRKLSMNCRGELVDLAIPKVMGILNITPDSFYDGGKYSSEKKLLVQIEKMMMEGSDFLDVGAYSSRPGAEDISSDEELRRLAIALKIIRKRFPECIVSVDTFRSTVAKKVVQDYDVDMINDISAGDMDSHMFQTVADLKVPYIMMHMQGNPQKMQDNPSYKNVVKDIIMYFSMKIEKLKLMGVDDVIIDPGFGFGKSIDHNYQLVHYLNDFKVFELPILVGFSRKSMIYKALDITAGESLNGTTVLNALAIFQGANILRVHDVKQAKETIRLASKVLHAKIDNWHE